jgi:hypothetical protein
MYILVDSCYQTLIQIFQSQNILLDFASVFMSSLTSCIVNLLSTFSNLAGCAVTACPATEVPNSNYAVRGSIHGVTGHFFDVTCDDGYIGGGTMTCGPNRLFNDIFCDGMVDVAASRIIVFFV